METRQNFPVNRKEALLLNNALVFGTNVLYGSKPAETELSRQGMDDVLNTMSDAEINQFIERFHDFIYTHWDQDVETVDDREGHIQDHINKLS